MFETIPLQVDTTILGLEAERAKEMPYIASMGIYVVSKEAMISLLRTHFPEANDFGSEVIPGATKMGMKVCVHCGHFCKYLTYILDKICSQEVAQMPRFSLSRLWWGCISYPGSLKGDKTSDLSPSCIVIFDNIYTPHRSSLAQSGAQYLSWL